jgi:uncharacterized protein
MLDTSLMAQIGRSGFAAPEAIVHLFIGGSELHGAKVGKTDDLDIYGVFIGTPNDVLGLDPLEHFVWSTATDDRRNGPDDVDITLYSLEKWARMAVRGNATALHFLFADATATSEPVWALIQSQACLFLSKRSSIQFLGFADNQLRRITGEMGQGPKGRRPEYECKYGYDSKAAMHCLRLYFECIELMQHGRITLPRPEREYLVRVREGAHTLEEFKAEAARLRQEAEQAAKCSSLPDECDRKAISEVVAKAHLEYWQKADQL